jgi:DNA-binding transcriptional LysR family regulator
MNLRQIEAFHALMTNHTASRAAEVLRISQPAVSKAIQELERKVGFPLFERVKSRLVPTAEAHLLHREVARCFTGMDQLRNAAARIRDFGAGELKLASLASLANTLVPLALRDFHTRHPNVAITFQSRMSSEVRDLVATGQFDLGLAADEIDLTGVDYREYAKYRAHVALHPGHPLEKRERITPADLHGLPFIALAPQDTTRRMADQILREHESEPQVVLETPFSATVCAMVLAELGCGLVNPLTAHPYLKLGLVLKPFTPAIYFRSLLLYPTDRRPSRIVRDCMAALDAVANGKALGFRGVTASRGDRDGG